MDHAKKMALISPETLQRLRQEPSNNDFTTQLDTDMKNVLNTNLSDHDKWALYQETLQRYLHFMKQDREPIKIPIIQDAHVELKEDVTQQDETANDNANDVLNILNSIPRSYRDKANSLLNRLSSAKSITWNKDGVVTVNNNLIPNSNITDLIGDSIRYRKHSNPAGWREFTTVLKKLNIPHELIGNHRRRQYISKPFTPTTASPTTRSLSGRRRRNFSASEDSTYDADTERPASKLTPKVSWKRFSF